MSLYLFLSTVLENITKIKELQNCYDRVLMNPSFLVRDKELKFVFVSLENIKDNGILAVILPKTCVKGTDKENIIS